MSFCCEGENGTWYVYGYPSIPSSCKWCLLLCSFSIPYLACDLCYKKANFHSILLLAAKFLFTNLSLTLHWLEPEIPPFKLSKLTVLFLMLAPGRCFLFCFRRHVLFGVETPEGPPTPQTPRPFSAPTRHKRVPICSRIYTNR